ncbi:MAG: papain-like cysteine protease family protein [bacterium]|nr:papain-like cysteine protease family protein [bacterium]
MKKKILFGKYFLLLVLLPLAFPCSKSFAGGLLPVPEKFQENNQWCWAGSSQAILCYYGLDFTQTVIAQYGTQGINTWNWLWGETPADNPNTGDPPRKGIDLILGYFGAISSTGFTYALSNQSVDDEITAGRPFVIRWGWTAGGGHFLVARGVFGDTIHYMDPWPGNGYTIALYDWVVSSSNHTWTHSLQLTTNPPPCIFVDPDTLKFNIKTNDTLPCYDTATMTIKNTGNSDLYVSDITKSYPWIMSVGPTNFTVAPGDSQAVTIIVTSAGLSIGAYCDSISISSNDPDRSLYIEPVIFVFDTIGIEEPSTGTPVGTDYNLSVSENPFSKSTIISYHIGQNVGQDGIYPAVAVSLAIYDLSGRCVKTLLDGEQKAGNYNVPLNAKDLKTGIYFVRLTTICHSDPDLSGEESNTINVTKKITIIK